MARLAPGSQGAEHAGWYLGMGPRILPTRRRAFPTIIDHETARAHRIADSLDKDIADGLFDGSLSIAQLLLACALPPYWHWPNAKMDLREGRPSEFQWRSDRSNLSTWIDQFSKRPSIQETIPIER